MTLSTTGASAMPPLLPALNFAPELLLRAQGIKVERASSELNGDIKRLGEKFSKEWIRSVGPEANSIFIPYYSYAYSKK